MLKEVVSLSSGSFSGAKAGVSVCIALGRDASVEEKKEEAVE